MRLTEGLISKSRDLLGGMSLCQLFFGVWNPNSGSLHPEEQRPQTTNLLMATNLSWQGSKQSSACSEGTEVRPGASEAHGTQAQGLRMTQL